MPRSAYDVRTPDDTFEGPDFLEGIVMEVRHEATIASIFAPGFLL
jgi:hypothetical protein